MKRYIPRYAGKRKQITSSRMIAVCVLLIAAIATLSVGITLAKMVSTASGSDSAQVAAFIVEATGEDTDTLEIDCGKADRTVSYTFAVTNTKDGKTAEVAFSYNVIVTLPEALPDGITMTLDGKTGTASSDNKTVTFADKGHFEAGSSQTNTHRLVFSVPDADSILQDYVFENTIVSIRAEQLD